MALRAPSATVDGSPRSQVAVARALDVATRIWAARGRDWVVASVALIVVYLSFHAGGYFPGVTGLVAAVLVLLLLVRVAVERRPFAGLSRGYAIGAAALGMFGLWCLWSGAWSDAPARALIEYDRALLYLAGFALFGALGHTPGRLRWMVRAVAAAAAVVCLCGLATRLFPDVWTLSPAVADERLNYPLTYWNALGLMAALGLVLCFALSADPDERPLARVLGAAALPILGVTLLLTFSRGSIAAGAVGLVALVLLGRPRALPSALLVAIPTVVAALIAGYSADLLATDRPTTPAAAAQGHVVAIVVGLSVLVAVVGRLALLRIDGRLAAAQLPERLRRPPVKWAAGAGLALLVAFGLFVWPVDLPGQFDSFVNGEQVNAADLRSRLGRAGDNGRIEHWRAALEGFHERPLTGTGAGTFALQWDRIGRTDKLQLQDAHSLYVEVLGELGLIGLLLVLTAIITVLVGFVTRARGGQRVVGAALFGAGLTWALAAGIDWVWEMPAVTFWFFAAGGLALSRSRVAAAAASSESEASSSSEASVAAEAPDAGARSPLARRLLPLLRPAIALGCLMLAIAPVRIYLSDSRLRDGVRAFQRDDCPATVDDALGSIAALAVRPEPHVLLGYCDVRLGQPALAVTAMKRAVAHDPHNWEVHYGLSLVRAAAGLDPRPEARTARRLNPRDSVVAGTLRLFNTNNPQEWRRRARGASLPAS